VSAFLQSAAKLLGSLFLVGSVGSLVVIAITLVEDLELLFHNEESKGQIG
jgi:hypothetical protein